MTVTSARWSDKQSEIGSSQADMVEVPAGSFEMGSSEGSAFERPVHEVWLDRYWIDATPVTNSQFSEFVAATGYQTEAERRGVAWGYQGGKFEEVRGLSWRLYNSAERSEHPVVLVSWHDAECYARWAHKSLPTEAEWEKAAQSESGPYPWGHTQPTGDQSNFAAPPKPLPPTTPVRRFPPNRIGAFDMVGNVWQWCSDWYGADYYGQSVRRNPRGPAEGSLRVRRGGSWNVIQSFRLRTANRGALYPDAAMPNGGFRCVMRSTRRTLPVHLTARAPRATVSPPVSRPSSFSTPAEREVVAILDELRPAMRADGGDIELLGVHDGAVVVRLAGTCETCPSAELTFRRGIEMRLKARLPWVRQVVRRTEGARSP